MEIFVLCTASLSAMLFLPGMIFNKILNIETIGAVCLAPMVSIAMYSIGELLCLRLGIPCSAYLLFSFALLIVCAALVLERICMGGRTKKKRFPRVDYCKQWPILLYLLIGLMATYFFFIKQLDGADSFFQGWDNVTHLNGIRALMNSGVWNPLSLSGYTTFDTSPYFDSGSGFYPSAMHVLCAAVASIFDTAPTVALNSVNAVMIGLVFPLGFYQLISTLTNHNLFVAMAGSLLCLGNAVAPWDMLIYGPLFPNLFAFSFIPAVMSSFIMTCNSLTNSYWSDACRDFLITLLGALTVFLGHPNGIFSLIVLLAPYLLHWGWCVLKDRGTSLLLRGVLAAAYLLFIGVFWVICFNLPMFSSVVGVSWPAINNSFLGAAVDALAFSYVWRPENLIVSFFMVMGVFSIVRDRKFRWLLVSMLTTQFLYAICAGTEGGLKQLLTGFWYTDYYRVAALAAFAGSIVACFGLGWLFEWSFNRFVGSTLSTGESGPWLVESRNVLSAAIFLLIGYFVFNGNIVLPFLGHVELPLGYQAAETERQYNKALIHYDVLTVDELAFVNENSYLFDGGSTIINSPNDGSLFLYAIDNMNMYYRSGSCPGSNEESEDSYLIRTNLFNIANDERVKNAVRHIGAKYVLQLDYADRADECRIFYNSYYPEDWIGIQSISEDTPGFTLIAKNKDMRIFRIDDF